MKTSPGAEQDAAHTEKKGHRQTRCSHDISKIYEIRSKTSGPAACTTLCHKRHTREEKPTRSLLSLRPARGDRFVSTVCPCEAYTQVNTDRGKVGGGEALFETALSLKRITSSKKRVVLLYNCLVYEIHIMLVAFRRPRK